MKRTWNYRIIRFADHKALHEVHYEDGVPVAYGSTPATFVCDLDQDDIGGGLERAMRDAHDHPVLAVEDIGRKAP